MTWQQLLDGVQHDFSFRDMTDVQANVQRNNTFLSFTMADGMRSVYRLKGFPQLPVQGIEVVFSVEKYQPDGQLLDMRKDLREYVYEEPEDMVEFFATYPAPHGSMVFGYQQALNGLTQRLPQFEGHPKYQGGHRLYNLNGTPVQPVTFDVSVINESSENVGDGAIELTEMDGVSPFEYSFDAGQTYTAGNTLQNVAAGDYTVAVRDSLGVLHAQTIIVSANESS